MKFSLEQHRPDEPDLELVTLLVLGATGILALAWLLLPVPVPVCAFHAITGVPCPACGGTRCIRSLLSGHAMAAFAWNPLVFVSAFVAAAYALYAGAATVLRLPRIRVRALSSRETNAVRVGAALIVGANWLYLVHHFSRLPA